MPKYSLSCERVNQLPSFLAASKTSSWLGIALPPPLPRRATIYLNDKLLVVEPPHPQKSRENVCNYLFDGFKCLLCLEHSLPPPQRAISLAPSRLVPGGGFFTGEDEAPVFVKRPGARRSNQFTRIVTTHREKVNVKAYNNVCAKKWFDWLTYAALFVSFS